MSYQNINSRGQYKTSCKKQKKRHIIQENYSQSQQNDSNSNNSDEQSGYLDKIQQIWKNIKKTKNISVANSSCEQNSSNEQEETISYKKNKQIQKIYQQSDLIRCQQNIQVLMKKLISAQEQIQYLQYELDKEINSKQLLKKQLKKIKIKLQFREKQNNKNQINQIDQQDIKMNQQKNKRIIQKYQLKVNALLKQLDNKNLQMNQLIKNNQNIQIQLQNFNKTKASISHQINDNFKGSQILQLNEAYKTIQRLAALLKSTEQYRSLGSLAEQFKSIHFLNNIPKRLKQNSLNIKLNSKNKQSNSICNCMQIRINQKLLWTPMLCYKKMLQMKLKYNTLNEDCIQQVLFEMNRLYISKEQTRVSKLKNLYQTQILRLKKKTQLTYDQILAKKQIQRLKKQLTSKKKGNKFYGQRKISIMQNDPQQKQINQYQKLRAIGQYQDELKLKQRQIKLLQQRIKLYESQTSTYDKTLYMQGVIWIIDKLLQELDLNNENFRSFQNVFRRKINTAKSSEEWLRLYKQMFESIEQLSNSLIQKILTIKQTTIKKMNVKN